MSHPFEVGKPYRNRAGEYVVEAIEGSRMTIRYTDGRTLTTSVDIQARIWENIQFEKQMAMTEERKRQAMEARREARQRKARTRRKRTIPTYDGFEESDFEEKPRGVAWSGRMELGRVLAYELEQRGHGSFGAWIVPRQSEVEVARHAHYEKDTRETNAALFVAVSEEGVSYGFHAGKPGGKTKADWPWSVLLKQFAKNDQLRQTLHAALQLDPEHLPAHRRLAAIYAELLIEAEARNARADAARFEMLLRRHDRGEHAHVLAGLGRLELDSEPSGARVRVMRFVERDRRLVEEDTGVEGTTPFSCELASGSYVVVLEREGHAPTRYPVRIVRGETWETTRPGGERPSPVRLLSDLGDGEIHVPAGFCSVGGDEHAAEPVPAARVWIDDFVVRTFPVTCAEYLAFLDALFAAGEESRAITHAPRWPRGAAPDEPLVVERAGGRFVLRPDPQGQAVDPRWPIALVDWRSAHAYARWAAEVSGLPWRLPNELEWEKAARGVDERPYPWGAQPEPTWARIVGSTALTPSRAPADSYPIDCSPYGMRGAGGNVRDWCANAWTLAGPVVERGVLVVDEGDPSDPAQRSIRGGAWNAVPASARLAGRFAAEPDVRFAAVGFRLVRSV